MSKAGMAVGDSRRRTGAVLVAAGLLVLALLAGFAIALSSTQAKSRRDIEARVHERSVLAAALLDSLLSSAQQQAAVYRARFGGPVVSGRTLDAMRQGNRYVLVLDRGGRVLASSRGFTSQARADLHVSAALALVRAGRPYGLGNELPYGRAGVINFAVAFATPYGERFLLTGFAPQALGPFLNTELRKIPGVRGAHNYILDGHDAVLASTNPAIPVGYRFTTPAEVAALSQASGERNGRYYDESRLTNSTWRIVLAAPSGPLFASVSGFRKWVPWVMFVVLALVAAAALVLGSHVLHSAESELREANSRLAAVNLKLEEANQRLAHDALHDPLTGLPNRVLLMDRLAHMLARSDRDPASGCAVLFIDLDNFKLVNDTLSHAVGDQLLAGVAERFKKLLRPGDTVARLGGDEFALALDTVSDEREAVTVAERLLAALEEPIVVDEHRLLVQASIGIALSFQAMSAAELIRSADLAMYHAKREGKAAHAVFEERMYARPRA